MGAETSVDVGTGAPKVELGEFVSTAKQRGYIGSAIAVLMLIAGALMWSSNMWAALMAFLIGGTQLVIAATLIPRVSGRDTVKGAGNTVVQHSWLLLSVAVATLAIYPSPFFEVTPLLFWLAMLLGVAWAFLGAFNLYQAITTTGARATI